MAPKKKVTKKVVTTLAVRKPKRGFEDVVEGSGEDLHVINNSAELDEAPVQDTGMAKYSNTPAFDASDLFIPKLRLACAWKRSNEISCGYPNAHGSAS